MKRLALLSIVVLLMAACDTSDSNVSVAGSWQMTSGIVDGVDISLVADHPITMSFEDGQVNGTAACNSYFGPYETSGSSITFQQLAFTEMACFPDELMQAEQMFGQAMTRVDTVSVDGDLTLSGDGVEMVFEPFET